MAKIKTKDEVIEEWWTSLSSYEQVQYLKKYVPRVFDINHSVKLLIWDKVFEEEVNFTL